MSVKRCERWKSIVIRQDKKGDFSGQQRNGKPASEYFVPSFRNIAFSVVICQPSKVWIINET